MKRWFILVAVLAPASLAWGFSYITNSGTGLPIKWPAGSIPVRIMADNSVTLSDGTTRATAIQEATQSWNDLIGSAQFTPQILPAGPAGDGNGVSEIVFASSVYGRSFDANVLAVTTVWSRGNQRTEADTIFNTKWTWDSYRGSKHTGTVDIQRVAIHELGHNLGLDHPDEATPPQSVPAIMNSHISNIDAPTSDDIAGAQSLYGPPGVPANDNFSNAIEITLTGNTAQLTGFNTNATKETGEPDHAGNVGGHSVWWKWTAPADGNVKVDTTGSIFDTTLGIYTGSSVSTLTTIASNDDVNPGIIQHSELTFAATGGTTYYLAVDGFNGDAAGADSGAITLDLTFFGSSSAPPTITGQPSDQTTSAGGGATFTVTAAGNPTGYQWFFGSTAIGNATSPTLTLTGVQSGNAGSYHVTVTNANGSVTSNNATLTVLASQLANETVTTGHGVTFTAGGSAGGDVIYSGGSAGFQWQVSTDGGLTWTNLANNSTYSGADTGTLELSGVTASLNGNEYRYVISVLGGTSTSNAATLTVAQAFFPHPTCIAVDGSGNLYVGDASADTIRKITATGTVTTLAGSSGQAGTADGNGANARFNQPGGLVSSTTGTLSVSDTANATIRRIAPDGSVTTLAGSTMLRGNADGTGTAATFSSPVGITLDASGTLFIADALNHTIRLISASGVVTTFAGGAGVAGSADGTGTAARFNSPNGVAVDGSGNVYVGDTTNNTIRAITPAGVVTTLAGLAGVSGSQDGTGVGALFNHPTGLAVDNAGNLYLADTGNSTIRKITPAGVVTTLAGLSGIAGLTDGTGSGAFFNQPLALALDSAGNVYVADTGNATIRKITPTGTVTTMTLAAGTTGNSGGNNGSGGSSGGSGGSTPTPPASSGGGGGAVDGWLASALGMVCLLRWCRRKN
jgi:sugar lactone lactonase YvrE